jgi:cytochrome c-type biogenesis protein CcmH
LTAFALLAAVLTAAALALVGWPLFRGQRAEPARWPIALMVLALALPLAAALLYRSFSNWDWDPEAQAAAAGGHQSFEQMAAKLDARVRTNPADLDAWLMLGRTRFVMKEYPAAVGAFSSAYRVSNGQNLEAVIGYGESLALVDQSTISGKAGQLFEEALKLDATNSKALFYAGAAAAASNRPELARERWATLVRQPLPDQLRAVIAIRIGQLDEQLGRAPDAEIAKLAQAAAAETGAPLAVPAAGGAPVAAADTAAGPSGPGAATVRVSVSPAIAARIPAGAQLFVLARDPTQPGPPFAAKRLTGAQLPLVVVLSADDAMIPGRTIRDAKQLTIVARYSASGRPIAASGDFYGEVAYDLAAGKQTELVIDKQVP